MTSRRKHLAVAIAFILLGVALVWRIDAARQYQRTITTEGCCWEPTVQIGSREIPTEAFIKEDVAIQELNPVDAFFNTRMRHRILLYMMLGCAVIGWGGSILLRILLREEGADERPLLSTDSMVASFVLSCIAAAILFLIMVSARLAAQKSEMQCICDGYSYMAAVGGLGCGLFVVLFFKWFEKWFTAFLDRMNKVGDGQ